MKNKNDYYLTTAITYTSGKPHIGNTYEIILADAIARSKRQQGYDATSIPIFALSANAFAEDIEYSINAGMNEHLCKPIDIKDITLKIKTYINK